MTFAVVAYNHYRLMDYFNLKKQRQHAILLLVGYVAITIAIVFATVILVYQAYGFGIDKNGTVIQNGVVFFSSKPNPAKVYLNGKLSKSQTNTRDYIPAGIYKIRIALSGYQDWRRTIEVDGGTVTHFDYPLLLPTTVKTTTVAKLDVAPSIASQSPDRRWLILSDSAATTSFQVYDLKNIAKPATVINLPANLATKPTVSESWQVGEWSDDNQHLLLQHLVDGKTEFIMLDRSNPDQSVNLNRALSSNPTSLTLNNKKYDKYYLYFAADQTLQTASLNSPAAAPLLSDVLAYKSYADDTVLYITSADAPNGKVQLKLQTGTDSKLLRSFPSSSHYLLDLASYSGVPYVIASSTDENKVYIYRDPLAQLSTHPAQVIVPIQVLRVIQPSYESFSNNAQYIMAENGNQFAVYDLENKTGYNYTETVPLEAPQTHANWMDGNRLTYVSSGKLQILDFDAANQRSYVPSNPTAQAFFGPDYLFVYTLLQSATGTSLTSTSLLAPAG
jgi:hypothetical protein